jgi:hypothetical protein
VSIATNVGNMERLGILNGGEFVSGVCKLNDAF